MSQNMMIPYFYLPYFYVSNSALSFARYSGTLLLHRRSLHAFHCYCHCYHIVIVVVYRPKSIMRSENYIHDNFDILNIWVENSSLFQLNFTCKNPKLIKTYSYVSMYISEWSFLVCFERSWVLSNHPGNARRNYVETSFRRTIYVLFTSCVSRVNQWLFPWLMPVTHVRDL